jgi:mannosyltransferase OCH1-like enzyme
MNKTYNNKMILPKIIHQIWIGPKKRPDIWMDTVKKFASDFGYEYKLWNDENVSKVKLINQKYYDNDPTYHGKADMLRYELLYRHGGIFIDADSVITKPEQLNELLEEFDADAGFGFEIDNVLVCQGVCMSIPKSLFMKLCIDEIPKRDFTQLPWIATGPKLITQLLIRNKNIPIKLYKSTIFYPIRWHGIQDINMHEKMELPPESVMFQYGYTTNNLESKI